MGQPTDIELSVDLSAKDIQKTADELGNSIKNIFDESAGKPLNAKLKSMQQQLGASAAKATELSRKMKELETTKVPTDEYKELSGAFDKALQKSTVFQEKYSSKLEELKAKMKAVATVQVPTSEYENLQERIEGASKRLEKLNAERARLDKGPQTAKVVQRLQEIEQSGNRVALNLEQAQEQMEALVNSGKAFTAADNTGSAEYQKLLAEYEKINSEGEKLEENLKKATQNMENLVRAGKDFKVGNDSDEYSKLSNQLADVNNKSRVLIERWKEQNNEENKVAVTNERLVKSTRNLGVSMRQATKHIGKTDKSKQKLVKTTKNLSKAVQQADKSQKSLNLSFKHGFLTLLRYGLGISGLFVLFNKLRGATMDGLNNMAAWNDGNNETNQSLSLIASSLATLKNSLGALFAVFVNALAPAIDKFINLLITGINYVNQFISALMGKTTYMKAERVNINYAESLGLVSKKAKEAQKALEGYLSPIDEINKYRSNVDFEADALDSGFRFTETPIDPKLLDLMNKIKSIIDKIKDKLKDLWDWLKPVLQAIGKRLKDLWDKFKKAFFDALGDWRKPVNMILDGIKRIGNALKDIFTDPRVVAAWNRYLDSVAELLGTLAGTALRIGLNIGANLAQGIARALEEKKEEIKDFLVEMFDLRTHINHQLSEFAKALGEISDVLLTENAIRFTSELIQIFMEAGMLIIENATRFVDRFIWTITQPIIDNVELIKQRLEEAFGVLADVFNTIEQRIYGLRMWLKELWEDHLDPLFESIEKHLDEILQLTLNTLFPDTIKFIADLLNVISEELIKVGEKIIAKATEILENIEESVAEFVKDVLLELDSIVKFLDEKLWEIKEWFDELWDEHLDPLFDAISQDISEIINLLFDTLFPDIVSMMGDLFRTITDTITGIVEAVVEGIVRLVERTHTQITETVNFVLGKLDEIIHHIDEKLIPAIGTIGEAFASEEMKTAIEELGTLVVTVVTGAVEEISKFIEKAVDSVTTIISDNAEKISQFIKDVLDVIGELSSTVTDIVEDIKKIIDDLWANHLEPFIDNMTEGISKVVSTILDAWHQDVKPFLDELMGKIKELWDTYLEPLFSDIADNIGYLAELLGWYYSTVLIPIFGWLTDTFFPILMENVEQTVNKIKLAVETITTLMQIVQDTLNMLLSFVKDVFTVGWSQAWENLKETFIGNWEEMGNRLKGIVNTMIDIINNFINMVAKVWNKIVDAVGEVHVEIPDWVPFIGGNSFGPSTLPKIPEDVIPHLAQGAVIPPNNEFLAMLGDQNKGVNIETPLDTMVQAFKQAMSEMGNNNNLTLNLLLPNKQVVAQYVIEGGRVLQTSRGRNPFDLAVN